MILSYFILFFHFFVFFYPIELIGFLVKSLALLLCFQNLMSYRTYFILFLDFFLFSLITNKNNLISRRENLRKSEEELINFDEMFMQETDLNNFKVILKIWDKIKSLSKNIKIVQIKNRQTMLLLFHGFSIIAFSLL